MVVTELHLQLYSLLDPNHHNHSCTLASVASELDSRLHAYQDALRKCNTRVMLILWTKA